MVKPAQTIPPHSRKLPPDQGSRPITYRTSSEPDTSFLGGLNVGSTSTCLPSKYLPGFLITLPKSRDIRSWVRTTSRRNIP